MININVKKIQNGEIVSKIKKVNKIYVTLKGYDQADNSEDNVNLQQRLNPISQIDSNIEIISGSFKHAKDNIILQKYLYPDSNVEVPDTLNKINKVTQIWTFIDGNFRQLFSLISSCFGSGTWMSSEKWSDSELWKY